MVRRHQPILTGLIGLIMCWAGGAYAGGDAGVDNPGRQTLQETCLPGSDNGIGLAAAVGPNGILHLSRIVLVSGDLLYTSVSPTGEIETETLARRVSRFPANAVSKTDILVEDDGLMALCFRNAARDRLDVFLRRGGEWGQETVVEREDLFDDCEMAMVNGQLVAFYRTSTGIFRGDRGVDGGWEVAPVLEEAGLTQGPAVGAFPNGRLVVVSRRQNRSQLNVSFKNPDEAWDHRVLEFPVAVGMSVRVVPAPGGRVWIVHGFEGNQGSDAGLIVTFGDEEILESLNLGSEYIGGSVGAARGSGQQLRVLSRELRRSAVFGNFDGLRYYDGLPIFQEFVYVAEHDSDDTRTRYRFVNLVVDPFGLPIGAFVKEASNERGQPGLAPVCILKESDRDGDGLADRVEQWLGSDPNRVDTDGDGVSDFEEVMMGINPRDGSDLPDGLFLGGPDSEPDEMLDQMDLGPMDDVSDAGAPRRDRGLGPRDADLGVEPDDVADAGAFDQSVPAVPDMEDAQIRPDTQAVNDAALAVADSALPRLAEEEASDSSGGCVAVVGAESTGLFFFILCLWAFRVCRREV